MTKNFQAKNWLVEMGGRQGLWVERAVVFSLVSVSESESKAHRERGDWLQEEICWSSRASGRA